MVTIEAAIPSGRLVLKESNRRDRASVLAIVIPIVVFSTRFQIYSGLWVNDIAVIVVAAITLCFYRPRWSDALTRLTFMFWLYLTVHSLLMLVLQSNRSQTIVNNWFRITSLSFSITCFCAFYRAVKRDTALAGLRKVAWIFAVAVIVHSFMLNALGPSVLGICFLRQIEADSYARDMNLFGFGRAFGLAFEPYWAAAYLFLFSAILKMADPRRGGALHTVLLAAGCLTAATSLVLFLPLWIGFQFTGQRRARILVPALLGLFLIGLGLFKSDIVERTGARLSDIVKGKDMSANVRIGPGVRTIVGTLSERPFLGFGLGNADLADIAGFSEDQSTIVQAADPGTFSGICFLELLGCVGLPGVIFYLLFIYVSTARCAIRRYALLWAVCLLATANAYLFTHVQFYFLCLLSGLLQIKPRFPAHALSNIAVGSRSNSVALVWRSMGLR